MKKCELEVNWYRAITVVMFVAVLTVGCAGPSSLMKQAPEGESIGSPAADKAMVVFLRPSGVGFAVQSKVINVTSKENPQLVGFVGAKTKVAYQTEPGEAIFMVMGGENTPFMKADLQPGKTYYAKVSPQMGFLYARFALKPIRGAELDGEDFSKWYTASTLYTNSEESRQWAVENMEKIKEKRADKLPAWMEKPQEERDALTLNPDDGRL